MHIRQWPPVTGWSWLLLLAIAAVASVFSAGSSQGAGLAVYAIPSSDGREVWVRADVVGEPGAPVAVICDVSCRVMGCDASGCSVALAGLTPGVTAESEVSLTVILFTTKALETGPLPFIRAYVTATMPQTIHSADGSLQLTLVSTDTFTSDTYIAVIHGDAPPGPAPQGHRFIGSAYSVRASGALVKTDKPMSLRLYYDETTLAGAPPHTLAILAWDAFNKHWADLGGRLFQDAPEGSFLSVMTRRFTTYTLMVTPAWRDDFDDLSGLDFAESNNVTLGGPMENRMLILASTPGSGIAVSKPITPTTTIASWGTLTFTSTADSPTTTLTVDVLSVDGAKLLADVTSGASLAGIDLVQYPSLKLRANLSSTVAGETPALDAWRLTWEVEERKLFLPVMWQQ